ncbi:unnamed protein product [Caretta caretta]
MFEENDIVYCGVATDGSNHSSVKIFPVIIQYFDWNNVGLQSKLIKVQNTPNETADTIAHYVKETLEKNGLFEKCIAFTGDNCKTTFGGLRSDEDGKNDKPPTVLKTFFEYELSEIYLWHMHSLMSVFQTYIQEIERERNSVVEVLKSLNSGHTILLECKTHNFMSLKVKGLLAQKLMEGIDEECDKFCAEVDNMYSRCLKYLKKWFTPLEDFSCFRWITLSETLNYSDVEPCIKYLINKRVQMDDVKCFDQVSNLKKFTESCNSDDEFSNYLLAHQKWAKYFEKSKNIECHSELLKIA